MRFALLISVFICLIQSEVSYAETTRALDYFRGDPHSCNQLATAVVESCRLAIAESKGGEMDYDRYDQIAFKKIRELDTVIANPTIFVETVIEDIVGYGRFYFSDAKDGKEESLIRIRLSVYEECLRPLQLYG